MIKKVHDITLKDVSLLYETKSPRHLMKFRWLPIFLVKNRLEKLAGEIFEKVGGKSVDDLEKEFDKVMALNKIQLLEALYKIVIIEFNIKTKIRALKINQKKLKQDDNFKKAIKQIKEHTGIEIKTTNDLVKFEKHIQFKIDKFREVFPEPQKTEKKELSAVQIFYSYFNYLEEPYNEGMRLSAFVEIKAFADERIRKREAEKHKING